MVQANLTALEAVALAVRSEIESTRVYVRLARRVKNPAVREMLEHLAEEEAEQERDLHALYRTLRRGGPPAFPEQDAPERRVRLDPDTAEVADVVAAARDGEQGRESFYRNAAARIGDYKTRMFFRMLAERERHHAIALQEQLEELTRDPAWFEREETEAFYLGP